MSAATFSAADLFSCAPQMRTDAGDCRMTALTQALVFVAAHDGYPRNQFLALARTRLTALTARHPEAVTEGPLGYLLEHLHEATDALGWTRLVAADLA